MNKKDTRKKMIYLLAKEIRIEMNFLLFNYNCLDANDRIDKIRKLASLVTELLEDDLINDKYKKLLFKTNNEKNKKNIDLKLKTFKIIRNILLHFPMYETWDEIEISENILEWNNPKFSEIKNYFSKRKKFEYEVYIRSEYSRKYDLTYKINIKIPKINKYKPMPLKDIISEEDAIHTFLLIDSLLEHLGVGITSISYGSL